MHSHNYSPPQAYKRSFGESKALAAVWTGKASEVNWLRTVVLGWLNDLRRDLIFCARQQRLSELPFAARIRWNQRLGRLAGFRAGWAFYRGDDSQKDRSKAAVAVASGNAGVALNDCDAA